MAKDLTPIINRQIDNQIVKMNHIFKINGVDRSAYVINWKVSHDKAFGSASATFVLNNNSGVFGDGGSLKIEVGDIVELIETFQGDSIEWKRFYGQVKSRAIRKAAGNFIITLTCLDYISLLQNWDIDLKLEGTKVEVKYETLTPNYLPSPNGKLAQVYDFANDALATTPIPILVIKSKGDYQEDPQYDGFDIIYSTGQVKFGFPLNAEENYDVIAKQYYHYTQGLYVEDVLETLLTTPDGYGKYLFNETSAASLITNHLTTTYEAEEGSGAQDVLLPNLTSSNITIKTTVTSEYVPFERVETTLASDYATDVSGINWEILYLTDTTGFPAAPDSGETTVTAYIEDDEFTYTSVGSGNTLNGLVSSGGNSIMRESRVGDAVWYESSTPVTVLYLNDTSGLPESGVGNISGDTFSWTGKGSGNTLTGVTGLKTHQVGEYFEYQATYDAGQVWYLDYSNVTSDLTTTDFSLPSGVTVNYFDKRYGRILLESAISVISDLTCTTNYTFKTLQATGVEINEISFYSRELNNRYDAIDKVREYLAPNYIIRTQGDNKVWASYLNQSRTADYTLNLISGLDYLEDKDLYTRSLFYAKNSNPENIMFDENISFITTGHNYVGNARGQRLYYESTTEDGWYIFKSLISDAGYITVDEIIPVIYLGTGESAVPINNTLIERNLIPASGSVTTAEYWDKVNDDAKEIEYFKTTYYTYRISVNGYSHFSPDHEVIYKDAVGNTILTVPANDPNMNYVSGIYSSPSYRNSPENSYLNISTASFTQYLSSDDVEIDYDNVRFKLRDTLFTDPQSQIVSADFDYMTAITPILSAGNIIDGRLDTQVATAFFAEPPQGYVYAIMDLGQVFPIQAIDIVAGFFKPEQRLKMDISMKVTLKYSDDGSTFTDISPETHGFQLTGGESISFEEDALGVGFETRYLSLVLESVKGVEYKDGAWPVAFTELAAYSNIVLKSDSKLIGTTETSTAVVSADTTINVSDTSRFTDPDSGETNTAYIVVDADNTYAFTYTGLTSTSFLGCTIDSGMSEASGTQISQTLEGDTTVYDTKYLLPKLGDRVFKKINVNDEHLFSQTQLDIISKAYLEEFYKNHTVIKANVMYAPYLRVGQTVQLTDTYNNVNENYFIEAVSSSTTGQYQLILARYRSDS